MAGQWMFRCAQTSQALVTPCTLTDTASRELPSHRRPGYSSLTDGRNSLSGSADEKVGDLKTRRIGSRCSRLALVVALRHTRTAYSNQRCVPLNSKSARGRGDLF